MEAISDEQLISRLIDSPHKFHEDVGLIWQRVFEFPRSLGESVTWRKYKPTIAEVHALGCDRQAVKKASSPDKNPAWTYIGAITAHVEEVRAIETRRGHGFEVEHKPINEHGVDEGIYHAEISYRIAEGQPFDKNDKTELKDMIQSVFGLLEEHICR